MRDNIASDGGDLKPLWETVARSSSGSASLEHRNTPDPHASGGLRDACGKPLGTTARDGLSPEVVERTF
jgi:hypothetical protein